MAEVLVRYTETVEGTSGERYAARACGGVAADGLWEGWIEFVSTAGTVVRTPRETEQPNRDSLVYWAEGLTAAYLEGALTRALDTRPPPTVSERWEPSHFAGPARPNLPPPPLRQHSVLDPYTTYAQGEGILRKQLLALSRDHLTALVDAYRLNISAETIVTKEELAERIIREVQRSSSAA